ncbi:MarR family winged helix-turn-helix transcriptional regulator [Lachnotalea glycerini]|jgi:MarR family transcriptional regulator, organic hydroperoxide resistance regulator|uniref:HTH-type transcriptional regulator SarZ n=1 Tax=Lachnotalea glycerini TaxID=1763509 RepID=A0A371JK32_9FIRM|nr:MarR family transcriptional regulator [Lachnotalea glycerini]RDY33098.1 MarR family transcriptional regulator [Lachnotalea glycerini]
MKDDLLKLENQLCFPLYACAKEVVKQYKPYLDEIELTYTQYITMMVLWEKKSLNVKALGKYLYLDSGTLTPLLKKLEKQGFIKRERSTQDERNLIVTITKEGEALKNKAIEIPAKIGSCINIPAEDAKVLYRILYQILNQIVQ